MADRLIATSPTGGYRQLGVHGQAVVDAYRQLTAIIATRLSPAHAALLALPRIDPKGQRIDWYCGLDGAVQKAGDLPPGAQAALRAEVEKLTGEITALGQALVSGGGTGELVGRMLTLALTTPDPAFLYRVGDRPVLVMWGHESEGVAAAPVVPAAPPPAAAAPPPPPPPPPPPAAAAALAAAPAAGRGFWGWLLWLLPLLLLLLLILLVLKACEPLAPRIVEVPDPNPPAAPADPTPELAARLKALQEERDRLAQDQARLLAQCVPEEPTPPQRAEDLPPAPPPRTPTPPPEVPPVAELPEPEPVPVRPPPVTSRPRTDVVPTPTPPPPVVRPAPAPTPRPTPAPTPPVQACKPNYQPGDEPEVVVVVDGSGSMDESFAGGGSRISQARRSVANMIQGLPPGIDVGLVDFRGCDNVRRDKFYSDSERGQLIGEVNNLSPWGGTPLARSIERAGNIVSGDVESVIVIVSDGEESCGGDPCAAARALKAAKPNAVINVIDISGDSAGRATIQCVARATGGQVLKPNSPADLVRKLQQATRQPDMRACRE